MVPNASIVLMAAGSTANSAVMFIIIVVIVIKLGHACGRRLFSASSETQHTMRFANTGTRLHQTAKEKQRNLVFVRSDAHVRSSAA